MKLEEIYGRTGRGVQGRAEAAEMRGVAAAPEAEGSAFVPFAGALDGILRVQEERTIANQNSERYKRRGVQFPADRHRRYYVKGTIRVHEYPDGTLAVFNGP